MLEWGYLPGQAVDNITTQQLYKFLTSDIPFTSKEFDLSVFW